MCEGLWLVLAALCVGAGAGTQFSAMPGYIHIHLVLLPCTKQPQVLHVVVCCDCPAVSSTQSTLRVVLLQFVGGVLLL